MPSGGTTAAVHRYLDGDGAAQDMLDRGVLNYRAFARWLIETEGWKTTEEAVVSALRRYPNERETHSVTRARQVLRAAGLNSRTNVCSLTLPRSVHVHERLDTLFEGVDPNKGELLRIVEGDRAVKVLVSGSNLDTVRQAFDPREVLAVETGLAEYSLTCPRQARSTPGVLAVVHNTLATHRINVLESVSGPDELMIFVDGGDSLKTYQVLNTITSAGD